MIYVFKIPYSTIIASHVTGSRTHRTVGQAASDHPEYNLVINGDGWPPGSSQSNSIWYSDGRGINLEQMDYRPWVNFDKENRCSFGWRAGTWWGNYNAVSGTRFIVDGGAVNANWQKWSPELNARTAIGTDAEGNVIIAIVDGRDRPDPEGLSLKGLADLMIENGCVTAIDLDGGGSTTLAINGEVVNEPNDDGVPGQRAVINHLCLKLSEIPGVETPPDPEPEPEPEPEPVDNPITQVNVIYADGSVEEFVPK